MKKTFAAFVLCVCLILPGVRPGHCAADVPQIPALSWGDWKVEVNEYGNFRRVFLDSGWDNIDALEKKVIASGVKPNIWKAVLLLPADLSAEWKDPEGNTHSTRDTLSVEEMQFIREEYRKFERLVYVCSGGNLKLESRVIVLDDPVRITSEKDFFFPPPFKDELLKLPDWKPEETDSVVCIFPPGEMPLDAYGRSWGDLHGENCAGNANIGFVRQRLREGGDLSVVMQHEWLHQAECVMFVHLGYKGLPHLHNAGANGYLPDDSGGTQWLAWNTDLMYRYFRPGMWKRADMNSRSFVRPHPNFEGGFIKEWLVLGPFSNEEKKGLDVGFIKDEGKVRPDEGDKGPDDRTWKLIVSKDDIIGLGGHFKPNTNVVAYAHTYVFSPKKRKAVLWLGSDDGVKVFLNGLEIHRHRVDRGTKPDDDNVPIILQKGWNRLMFKVDQGAGGWGLCARIADPKLNEIPDLVFTPRKPKKRIVKKGEAIPFAWDGRYYSWDSVGRDPYAVLPELTQRHLRAITGIDGLSIKSKAPLLLIDPGPDSKTLSPVVTELDAADHALNNQMNARSESLAVLRFNLSKAGPRFPRGTCDLVLVRADIVEPWMDFLRSPSGIPMKESLIGFLTVNRQATYVFLTYLGDELPLREVDLVTVEKGGLSLSACFGPSQVFRGKRAGLVVKVKNVSQSALRACSVRISSLQGGLLDRRIIGKAMGDLSPGQEKSFRLVLGGRVHLPLGPSKLLVEATCSRNGSGLKVEKPVTLTVVDPIGTDLEVEGARLVGAGTRRTVRVRLRNNMGLTAKGEVRVFGWHGATVTPESKPVSISPADDEIELQFEAEFLGPPGRNASIKALFVKSGGKYSSVPVTKTIEMRGDTLFNHTFDGNTEGWFRRSGGYGVEHITGARAISGGSALVTDGGGARFGHIIIFGPNNAGQGTWTKSYSSKEYPFIEFDVTTNSAGNSGIIVKADGKSYVITLTGKFVEPRGGSREIGNMAVTASEKPVHVVFNLDMALDSAAEEGERDHQVEQLWFGDTRGHSSNQWRGDDVYYYIFDNFRIHK